MKLDKLLKKITIITGHYGSGKTNLAINIAKDLKTAGKKVVLVDLDIVNPYFRTADFTDMATAWGVELYAPPYANSNVDLPVLTAQLHAALEGEAHVIIDVGGDDAGAFALGGYAARINRLPHTMLYTVNKYRYLTRKPAEAAELMKHIEMASRIKVTHVVNNSNLAGETSGEDVVAGIKYSQAVCEMVQRPLAFSAVERENASKLVNHTGVYPVDIYVKTPW